MRLSMSSLHLQLEYVWWSYTIFDTDIITVSSFATWLNRWTVSDGRLHTKYDRTRKIKFW